MWKLQFDGGARPNPGKASCAFRLTCPDGTMVERAWTMKGINTNNDAEYEAAVTGIEKARAMAPTGAQLTVVGDSMLVIMQLSGAWKVREPRLFGYVRRARACAADLKITYRHVPREKNDDMDMLVREARAKSDSMDELLADAL